MIAGCNHRLDQSGSHGSKTNLIPESISETRLAESVATYSSNCDLSTAKSCETLTTLCLDRLDADEDWWDCFRRRNRTLLGMFCRSREVFVKARQNSLVSDRSDRDASGYF